MDRVRGFEVVKGLEDSDIRLPERSTKNSAGYDFFAPNDVIIPSYDYHNGPSVTIVWTGVKAYMPNNEFLAIYNRSSNPSKKHLVIPNGVGIIDSDYYSNESNDGEIGFSFYNLGMNDIIIHKGDKIGQGIFTPYLIADNDVSSGNSRVGGFGSTGR